MVKLLKPYNRNGVIIDADMEISLPPDIEAELVKQKLAKPAKNLAEKEQGPKG